jgi:hypothetical protein
MHRIHIFLSVAVLAVCGAGCGSSLSVASIQLGRGVNADSTVAGHTTTFKPDETVYIGVVTAGVGTGRIRVRWMYEGRVVGEPTKQVRDAGATEFHLQNAGGFPPGEYSAEVFLDDQSAGTRTFRVETPR